MAKKSLRKKIIEIPEKTEKEKKLFNNLLRSTQQFIQGRSFAPLMQEELFQRLHFSEQHRELFQEVLATLVRRKVLEIVHGRYVCKKTSEDIITGTMRLHLRGFGFVKPEEPSNYIQDIFIPKHLTKNAVDGDVVEVLINNETISEKGPEGRVLTIISRARTHLSGTIKEVGPHGTYYAYAPMLGSAQSIIVNSEDQKLKVGDRLVMKVLEWGSKESSTICELSHHIGHISDPASDISAAIEEFELRGDFPAKAIAEARQFGTKVPLAEIRKREDLRNLECFTIDPDTAKDFDDAISLVKDANGHYDLGVHIADVSHYVLPGSALDNEAQLRCNSTYFPGFCLPMLPKELSNNLCSLKPNVNRLTVSILMHFDPDGNLLHYRIVKSVIKSAKRFTYKEAKSVLDGRSQSPYVDTIKLMTELCGLLKKQRYERGSLEFGMPELIVIVDEKGVPLKTDHIVYDITHQLVEEFMLKANELVATHLSTQGKQLAYRVHDEPSEENMKDFSLLASAFGFQLSPNPTPREIQNLFDEAMETSYGQYLATSYIKRMRLAVYSSDNIGHFGLSLSHYCHFTSPIRRYIDLVVHRLLFSEGESKENLELISQRCSEQERMSSKAENNVTLLKKLRLLDRIKLAEPFKQFEAVVTRVKNFGLYFEILEFMMESYLHISELENDYYEFNPKFITLKGRYTGKTYRAGDKICVMLKKIDFITLDSAWTIVVEPSLVASRKKNVKAKKKKGEKKRKN